MTLENSSNVQVDLADRSYEIEIGAGILANIASAIKQASSGARCAIITDSNVNAAHGAALRKHLDTANIAHDTECIS